MVSTWLATRSDWLNATIDWSVWWIEVACFQLKFAWSKARLRYSNKAACVGGMFSRVFLPLVTRRCLGSLTLVSSHPLLYMMAKNRSSVCRESRLRRFGLLVNAISVSVRPGVLCQDVQAVFLPHPRNFDFVTPCYCMEKGQCERSRRSIVSTDVTDGDVTDIFATPNTHPQLQETKAWEEVYAKGHHITINSTNNRYLVALGCCMCQLKEFWGIHIHCSNHVRVLLLPTLVRGPVPQRWCVRDFKLSSG